MIIKVTIQSNESAQTVEFNVEIPDVFTPSEALSLVLKTTRKCTKYKVEALYVSRGWEEGTVCLLELLAIVAKFKFYKNKKGSN